MGLRILHSADWHLDSPFTSLPDPDRQEMRAEQKRLPGLLAEICRQENCDLVLLAGDLFDGAASRETLSLLKKALHECRVPVFITPGNHDYVTVGSPWLDENWPDNVCIFTGDWSCVDIPELETRVYGAGFTGMDCPPMLADFHTEGDFRYHIGILHGDASNPSSPYCPVTFGQVRDSGLTYLALGHIHQGGGFLAGDTMCAWPGSPMGRGWDETDEHGFCIVEINDSVEIRPVVLDTPKFREITLRLEGDPIAALENILPAVPTRDFYRITLTGCTDADLGNLREHFPHVPRLNLIDRTELPVDFWKDLGQDTLRGVYFRMLKEQENQADEERAEIVRQAAELSYRILEGREVTLP